MRTSDKLGIYYGCRSSEREKYNEWPMMERVLWIARDHTKVAIALDRDYCDHRRIPV